MTKTVGHIRSALLIGLAIGTCVGGDAVARDAVLSGAQTETIEKKETVNAFAYRFKLHGIKDKDLREDLVKAAQLTLLHDTPATSIKALERRIQTDMEMIHIAMRARGYFGAEVSYTVKKEEMYHVDITVKRGKLYHIDGYKLYWAVPKLDTRARDIVDQALAKGQVVLPHGKEALPEFVQAPEQQVISLLLQNGYPYPHITERKLFVDHAKNTVSVGLYMDAGPRAVFGNTILQGLESVRSAFVQRRVAWQEGDVFDISKVTKTRQDLVRSGVISSARIQYGPRSGTVAEKADTIKDGEALPMSVVMRESDHRTIGAGVAYSTALGPTSNVFWEHRNVFGQAERFRADLELGTSVYGVGATLSKPDLFGNRALTYQAAFKLKDEQLEAYDRQGINVSNSVAWQISNRWAVSGGVGLEYARIQEPNKPDDTFALISFPMTAKYDSSDDLLDPKKGWRFAASVTPYQAMDQMLSFVHNEASVIHYWSLNDDLVWANRAKFGALFGDGLDAIPADKRLYAGGGGSVRGYGFQMVGPLDAFNDPTGGRMLMEAGTEFRYNFTETIGGVAFVDAGQVSEDLGFGDGDLLYSAGVGARYNTVAGPIRFDIAVPLNKRQADDSFQIYISLGQAF